MKYPMNSSTIHEYYKDLLAHEVAQIQLVEKMKTLLQSALDAAEDDDEEWYREIDEFLENQHRLKIDRENDRFNEENLRKARGMAPKSTMEPLPRRVYNTVNLNDPVEANKLNKAESSFGEEMDEESLAVLFNEPRPKKKKQKSFKKMTNEEIMEWEKKQDNSSDIYKIKARVANSARDAGASLTSQGEMVCNSFVHIFKNLYDFAETVEDKDTKIKLIEKIRSQEGAPGQLIKAFTSGVKK